MPHLKNCSKASTSNSKGLKMKYELKGNYFNGQFIQIERDSLLTKEILLKSIPQQT